MRFSPGLSASLVGHFVKSGMSGRKRFPLVLMLEPTHRCNLACAGCDRIRLYAKGHAPDMTLDDCLGAVTSSGAPVVTVTGGEPLLYEELKPLLHRLFAMGRHVYLCTNGLLAAPFFGAFPPDRHLTLSFHVDGMDPTHDRITGRPGSFRTTIEAIGLAKKRGFRVWTNTSVYRSTDVSELVELFSFLKGLSVDGILVSPAFGYETVSEDIFLTRQEAAQKFRAMRPGLRGLPMTGTPLYLDFLEGKGQMACTPWGSPTRNPFGWKSPCYLVTDRYYPSFRELMERTDWEAYGPGRDERCANCMVHSGFEPTAMREVFTRPSAMLRLMLWNLFPS